MGQPPTDVVGCPDCRRPAAKLIEHYGFVRADQVEELDPGTGLRHFQQIWSPRSLGTRDLLRGQRNLRAADSKPGPLGPAEIRQSRLDGRGACRWRSRKI